MTTVQKWFENKKWIPQEFQKKCWKAYSEGKSGMLHAPTGSGKTFALWGGILNEAQLKKKHPAGIQAIWITLRKERSDLFLDLMDHQIKLNTDR